MRTLVLPSIFMILAFEASGQSLPVSGEDRCDPQASFMVDQPTGVRVEAYSKQVINAIDGDARVTAFINDEACSTARRYAVGGNTGPAEVTTTCYLPAESGRRYVIRAKSENTLGDCARATIRAEKASQVTGFADALGDATVSVTPTQKTEVNLYACSFAPSKTVPGTSQSLGITINGASIGCGPNSSAALILELRCKTVLDANTRYVIRATQDNKGRDANQLQLWVGAEVRPEGAKLQYSCYL